MKERPVLDRRQRKLPGPGPHVKTRHDERAQPCRERESDARSFRVEQARQNPWENGVKKGLDRNRPAGRIPPCGRAWDPRLNEAKRHECGRCELERPNDGRGIGRETMRNHERCRGSPSHEIHRENPREAVPPKRASRAAHRDRGRRPLHVIVSEDEARKQVEEIHADVAVAHNIAKRRGRPGRQGCSRVVVEHDPSGSEESKPGQRVERLALRGVHRLPNVIAHRERA